MQTNNQIATATYEPVTASGLSEMNIRDANQPPLKLQKHDIFRERALTGNSEYNQSSEPITPPRLDHRGLWFQIHLEHSLLSSFHSMPGNLSFLVKKYMIAIPWPRNNQAIFNAANTGFLISNINHTGSAKTTPKHRGYWLLMIRQRYSVQKYQFPKIRAVLYCYLVSPN